jgi:S1-C subfamily serine protease
MHGKAVQISAAISPGNSGGPVYDDRGNVIAVVDSKFDRTFDPNGENLGFAIPAVSMLDLSAWTFRGKGATILADYIKAEQALTKAPATGVLTQSR